MSRKNRSTVFQFVPNLPQYTCNRLAHDRTDRRLAVDLVERILRPLVDTVFLRGSVLHLGASHRRLGPEMSGRSGTAGLASGLFLATGIVSRFSHANGDFFVSLGGGLKGTGLRGITTRGHAGASSNSPNSPSSSSRCTIGMSRNFTDGGDRPLRVRTEALEERMDFAGAGREAVDESDEERPRPWVGCLSAASPRMATGRSHDGLGVAAWGQYVLRESSSS